MTFQLHVLTTGDQDIETAASTAAAIHPFVDYIHIREKHRQAREVLCWAERFLQAGVPSQKLIINDRLDVALAVNAGGVQLTEDSLPLIKARQLAPAKLIGCSAHRPDQAARLSKNQASFIFLGHIYETACKPLLAPIGLQALQKAAASSSAPIIAIGGVAPGHIKELKQAGAGGIAVMSGVFGSPDPIKQAIVYQKTIKREENS
ncbi:thiamine phosphate synthase [Bacillus xiapuensis]|uniref:thiamine phosphate synthase n=1 Tax=Bacillus xiapuensis TaxID=2014075 RepID=UPI0012FE534E|nr:thiamine phosphate synthase [Bacillus xiapuensis]